MTQIAEDPKQKLYEEIKMLKSDIEKKNKENNELKTKMENNEINKKNELQAQTEYLKGMIEGYKNNIDSLKEQNNKEKTYFEEKMEQLNIEIGNMKCQMAAAEYENDRKIINYKNYIKKLQKKLENLGFKFKDKNKNGTDFFIKTNTMV